MTYDLSSLGWDDTFAAAYAPLNRCDAAPARVLRADLGVCTVLGADGVGRASLAGSVLLGAARDPAGLPCAGDWVVVRRWPDRRHTVEAVLPRRTALTGEPGDVGRAGQVLAANMDVVAVLHPQRPGSDEALLHRLTARVRASGARPVVLLLSTGDAAASAATVHRVTGLAPDVPVLPVVPGNVDLGALRDFVAPGQTLGVLGGSAAERSALIDALAGATVLPARTPPSPRTPLPARSAAPERGDRTGGTAAGTDDRVAGSRVLVPVPGGGAVLDIAGVAGEVAGEQGSFRAATGAAAAVTVLTGVPTAAAAPAARRAPRPAPRLAAVAGDRPVRSRPRR